MNIILLHYLYNHCNNNINNNNKIYIIFKKNEFEQAGGVCALAWLIETNPIYEFYLTMNSTNQSCQINNEENDENFELNQMIESILENATSILCNLTSTNRLKQCLVKESSLLSNFVKIVLLPAANQITFWNVKIDHFSKLIVNKPLFRDVSILIR